MCCFAATIISHLQYQSSDFPFFLEGSIWRVAGDLLERLTNSVILMMDPAVLGADRKGGGRRRWVEGQSRRSIHPQELLRNKKSFWGKNDNFLTQFFESLNRYYSLDIRLFVH